MLQISSYDFLKDLGSNRGLFDKLVPDRGQLMYQGHRKQEHLQLTNNDIKYTLEIQNFVKRSISIIMIINSNFKSILRSMKNLFTF